MKGMTQEVHSSIRWEAKVNVHTSWFRVEQNLPMYPTCHMPALAYAAKSSNKGLGAER